MTYIVLGACAVLVCFAGAVPADAGTISLTDGNSSVTLDPGSPAGMSNWTVDGQNQLYQQWFWYRVGSSGPQYSLDSLGTPTLSNSSASLATVDYSGSNGLAIAVTYLLTGGAPLSGTADIGETIAISNTSSAPLTVHFYQYSNFILGDSKTNNSVQFQNVNDVQQTNPSMTLAESVIAPKADYREDGLAPTLLGEIQNLPAYTLAQQNNKNVVDPGAGPGNVAWAYEWDKTIAPNSTFIISKDKNLSGVLPSVPEPSSVALVLAGLFALTGLAARRARCK